MTVNFPHEQNFGELYHRKLCISDRMMDIRVVLFFIVTTGAGIIVLIERLRPYTKGQRFFREGFFNDFVLYSFLQSYGVGVLISFIIELLDGFLSIQPSFMRSIPVWGQVLIFLITHDFYIYWFHRFQHSSKYFWRIHEAHHSTHDVDWLSGSRSHSLEILINQTIEFAPIVILGASPEVAVIKGTIDALWGMYIHSNIDVHSGFLQLIINGPEMHRWHHANDEKVHNKNFSTKIALWDWLFGTAYFPKEDKPSGYGLDDNLFPKNYIKQHLYAFRKFD